MLLLGTIYWCKNGKLVLGGRMVRGLVLPFFFLFKYIKNIHVGGEE